MIGLAFRRCVPLFLALATSLSLTAADEGWKGGILAGVTRFERALTGDRPSFEPTVGLRTGYVFSDHFGWFLDGLYATTDTVSFGDATVVELRTGLDYLFNPDRKTSWFLGAANGAMLIDFATRDSLSSAMFSTGFGQRIRCRSRVHLRWEFRIDINTSRAGFHKTINDGKILVGWIWGSQR